MSTTVATHTASLRGMALVDGMEYAVSGRPAGSMTLSADFQDSGGMGRRREHDASYAGQSRPRRLPVVVRILRPHGQTPPGAFVRMVTVSRAASAHATPADSVMDPRKDYSRVC